MMKGKEVSNNLHMPCPRNSGPIMSICPSFYSAMEPPLPLMKETESSLSVICRYRYNYSMYYYISYRPTFGKVVMLRRENYVDAIDKESKHVTVMVHVASPVSIHKSEASYSICKASFILHYIFIAASYGPQISFSAPSTLYFIVVHSTSGAVCCIELR